LKATGFKPVRLKINPGFKTCLSNECNLRNYAVGTTASEFDAAISHLDTHGGARGNKLVEGSRHPELESTRFHTLEAAVK
jgi:hypothetical protein